MNSPADLVNDAMVAIEEAASSADGAEAERLWSLHDRLREIWLELP